MTAVTPPPPEDGTAPKRQRGWRRLRVAVRSSGRGLAAAWRHELAFRLECSALVLAVPLAFWLGGTAVERILLIGSVAAIVIVELLNSAVEAAIDRVGMEPHPLSARAKELASAAVIVTIALALLTWALLLWPE